MAWFKGTLKNSIYGLLGNPVLPSDSVLAANMEDIREAMLALLTQSGDKQHATVIRRVRYASDIQALWYLRGDLLAALASIHGEATARQQLQTLTRMFQGLLPGGLSSRFSPLTN
jgi:hypothetical protein